MMLDQVAAWGHSITRSTTQANRRQDSASFSPRIGYYDLQDALYDNTLYEAHDAALTSYYKADRKLPRTIRPIHNPVQRIVDWWITHLFPGIWTEDGLPDNGKPNMITYGPGTPEAIRLAVQQGFDWGNADVMFEQWAHDATLYGNVLVETRWTLGPGGEVYAKIVDPRWIVDLQQTQRLDVSLLRLNIPAIDADGNAYTWGRLITPDTIVTYRDNQPHGYDGNPAGMPNPFGFVPVNWGYFRYHGGVFGRTAIDGMHAKIDEVNALVSQINNFIMKLPNQPAMISSNDPKGLQQTLDKMAAAGTTMGANGDPDRLDIIAAGETASVHQILQNWGIGETDPHIKRMIESYEKDVPEVTLSEKLLDMQNVTRPGSLPLVQDVQGKYNRVCSNTLNGIVKTAQHMMTIGGTLANSGAWGPRRTLSDAQQKFLPFNRDSYRRGDLQFSLVVPDLVPPAFLERLAEAQAMERLTTPTAMRYAGMDDATMYGVNANGEANAPDAQSGLIAEQDDAARKRQTASLLNFNAGGF